MKDKFKPKCELIGADSNIFNLIGIASRALKRVGMRDEAKKMSEEAFRCGSYDEALCKILEYVDVDVEDDEDEEEEINKGLDFDFEERFGE